MKPHRIFLVLVFVAAFYPSFLQAQKMNAISSLKQDWAFIENKGQLANGAGIPHDDIYFYGHAEGVNVYCRKQSVSFSFIRNIYTDPGPDSFYFLTRKRSAKCKNISVQNMQMNLVGSNTNVVIEPSSPRNDHINFYYTHTPESGINFVKKYDQLIYKNIYDNIDLKLLVKEQGLKYEFIIYPGGKVQDIQIMWEGATPELLASGGIHYANGLGEMQESAPVIYKNNATRIQGKFTRSESGIFGFSIENQTWNDTVVIDPELVWATYYGVSSGEYLNDMVLDNKGRRIIVGYAEADTGLATPSAFQRNFGGGLGDGFIAQYGPDGKLLWSTYFGGSGDDMVFGVAVDKQNNIYAVGATESSSGIATAGAWKATYSDSQDVVLAKFNDSGQRSWGTYFGGTGHDAGFAVVLDSANIIYVCGSALSSGLATAGRYQTSRAGKYDGMVLKFNNLGSSLLGASYFGGSDDDLPLEMVLDDSGNINLTGHTLSSNRIYTKGALRKNFASHMDGFVAVLANDLSAVRWSGYFGGPKFDYIHGMVLDDSGNMYIAGSTDSDTLIATSNAYKSHYAKGTDGFLAKLADSGTILWGTYFGGDNSDAFTAVGINNKKHLVLAGITFSDTGIAGDCSWQGLLNGQADGFLAEFSPSGFPIWSTYFGGEAEDYGVDIALIGDSIFLAGTTASHTGIATKGAYKDTNSGSVGTYVLDAFVAKFVYCCPQRDSIAVTVCDTHFWNGRIYTKSGLYEQHFALHDKCDSVVLLRLTITNSNVNRLIKKACDSFEFHGKVYTSTQIDTWVFKNTMGCDSVVVLDLAVLKSNPKSFSVVTCDSFNYRGITYDSSGIYQQVFAAPNGCDSIITIDLSIHKSVVTYLTKMACYFYEINGIKYNASGIYEHHFTTIFGCDSLVVLQLTIYKSTKATLFKIACDSFTLNGKTYTSSGLYKQELTNSNGCDSLIILYLTINKSARLLLNLTACDSITFNGSTYRQSGNYLQKYTTPTGCDSFVELSLSIVKASDTFIVKDVCDSFVLNNVAYKTTGTYVQKIKNATGCDSNIHLDLTIRNSTDQFISSTACGEITVNGITYTSSGNYLQKYVNPAGCDYNLRLDLTILPWPRGSYAVSACQSYQSRSGKFLWTTSGIYYDTITNTTGCDSVIEVNLTIQHLDTSVSSPTTGTLRSNANGVNYQWLDCGANYSQVSGANRQLFSPLSKGIYAVEVRQSNCTDTSDCHVVTSLSGDVPLRSQMRIWPNPADAGAMVWLDMACTSCAIEVHDMQGRHVLSSVLKNGEGVIRLNQAGLYVVSIYGNDGWRRRLLEVR